MMIMYWIILQIYLILNAYLQVRIILKLNQTKNTSFSVKFESVQKFVLSQCSDLIALNLRSLTTMYIESQKLESFELNSDYLPSLEIISLGYNRLKTIPAFLYKLKNIQNIYLNNNKIKTIKVPRLVSNFID